MRRFRKNPLILNRLAMVPLGFLVWLGLAATVALAQPANDLFKNAIDLGTNQWGSVLGSNIGATNEVNEPNHAGLLPFSTIWYKWTAPASGEVTFDTFGSADVGGTNLDTVLAIYTGTNIAQLTQVAANDDYYPFTHLIQTTITDSLFPLANPFIFDFPLPVNGPSIARFNAVAGTTYYIAVDSHPGEQFSQFFRFSWLSAIGEGNISLSWALHPSGVLRFATEEYDLFTWMRSFFFSQFGISSNAMPPPLYQCSPGESLPGGGGYTGNATITESYYTFDPGGVLVTVTRIAGSSGRLLVDYTTADITNDFFFPQTHAVANTNYIPVSGTLVFDDQEMSKTIVIPIIPNGRFFSSTNEPNSNPFPDDWYSKDFQVVLSNPRLDTLESTNVSPPRLDTPFATATVRILSFAGLGDDPNENWTGDTMQTPPSHDVYNFGKKNYRVPRDINDFWTKVNIGVLRTHHREPGNGNDNGATLHYRVSARLQDSVNPRDWNNWFALNPSSDFAIPDTNNACPIIFPFGNALNQFTNFDFTLADADVTIPQIGFGIISFTVNNDLLTKLNKDFNVVIFRTVDNAERSVGEINECHVTILFDDAKPPAGSVDEFHNADFGLNMKPPVATTPPQLPHPGADGVVYDLAVQPDDKTIIVGDFGSYNTVNRNKIARINLDGSLDDSFDPGQGADDFISSLALIPGAAGQMIVGGAFTAYDNNTRSSVARINADGSLDSSFDPGVPGINGTVWAVAVQTDGKVVIGGNFTSINGTSRGNIARLNSDGSLDPTFDPGPNPPNGLINAVAITASGQIIIGGQFSSIGGRALNNLARLNSDGSLDTAYANNLGSGVNGTVWSLALQANGKLLVGGNFTSIAVTPRARLARLNANGTLDTTFDPGTGVDATVYSITPQADGTIYIGGLFTVVNGTHRLGLARLFADGTVDTSFLDTAYNQFAGLARHYFDKQAPGDARPFVYAAHTQSDGNVMIGGGFDRVGGGQADVSIRFPELDTNVFNHYILNEPKSRDGVRNRSNVARLIGGATPGPGNISLLYTNYTVNKSQGFIFAGLLRTNGSLGYASANFFAPSVGAQNGVDFTYNSPPPIYLGSWWPANTTQPFLANIPNAITRDHSDGYIGTNGIPTDIYGHYWFGYTPGHVLVDVLNFNGVEGDRDGRFQLANPVGADQFFLGGANIPLGVALGRSTAPFTIRDDTKKTNYLGFASASFFVNESGTNAVISVVRTNGTLGSCSVTYATVAGGTAVAGLNYTITSGTLNFPSTPAGLTTTTQTFVVPVSPDHNSRPGGYTVNLQLTSISGASYGLQNATLFILDNDGAPGTINFTSNKYGTNQTAGAVVLTVTRSGADKGTLSVQCGTADGSAVNGVNYVGTTNTLVWDDLDFSPRSFTVPLLNNGQVGANSSFQAVLFNPTTNGVPAQGALGAVNVATVTITNDNSFGKLQFSAPSYRVSENGGFITIPVIRTGGAAQSLTVNFATADGPFAISSGFPRNFAATNGTLTFGAGQVSTNFNVTIFDDGLVNPPLTNFFFTVNLSGPSQPGTLGFQSNAVVYIVDAESFNLPAGSPDTAFNPTPGLDGDIFSLALQPDGGIIAGGNFTFANGAPRNRIARFNRDASLDSAFLNTYAGANGAVQAVSVQTDGRILLAGGFTTINGNNRNRIARLQPDGFFDTSFNQGAGADNTVFALAETFVGGSRRVLIGGSFSTVNGAPRLSLTRLNNDSSLDTSFNPALAVNGTVYAIAVYPTNSIQGGKILIGGDFTAINGVSRNRIARLNPDGTLDPSFDPGAGASDAVRALALQLDGRVLVGGSFTNSFPASNGATFNHIARLNLDGSADADFRVGAGTDDTVFAIAVQPDTRILLVGQFLRANGVTRNHITRLLPDGTVDPAINFGAAADGYIDAIAIQPDSMMVIGGGFTHYDGLPRQHLARIYGGSLAGSGAFEFTSANFQADETATNTVVTVRRRGGTAGTVTIDFATSDDTAVAGVNYSNVASTLTFPVGETFQSVIIPLIHDSKITPDLTVDLSLANPLPPAGLADQPTATLTIFNDDNGVSFSTASYTVAQNPVGSVAFVDVIRQGGARSTATVDFLTTTNGTAVPGVDFGIVTNTLTFLTNQSTATVRIPILNNPFMANDTTVVMQLTNANNTLLFSPFQATLTILSTNQAPGQFTFTQTNYVVSEAGTNAILTVLRTNGHIGNVSVSYATVPGTATPGLKYNSTNGVLTFASGEMSKSIAVPILEEDQVEGDQTLSVQLSNPSTGTSILAPSSATVTILDDDVGVHLSQPFYFATEPSGNQPPTSVTITVLRLGANGAFSVDYATTNGTAGAGTDYQATSGTLHFADTEFIKTFSISILRNTNVTGPLSFGVLLANASAPAQLAAPSSATITISDSDPGIAFTNASFGVLKSATNVIISVLRSNVDTGTVSVNYATTNGTAIAGLDYVATSGSLVFSNGIGLQSFTVPIRNNGQFQGDRTFFVYLFTNSLTGLAHLIQPTNASVTITDDVSGISFSSGDYAVNENGVAAPITVLRSGYTNSTVSVDFFTADGTGKAGVNYVATNGTFIFTNGETAKTFFVTNIEDHVVNGDQTVLLGLTNFVGNVVPINPSAATLTILETDGSLIRPAGASLISESFTPPNGVIDPGETVSLWFAFRNETGTNTVDLVATLLATNGVATTNGQSQHYGVLVANGPSASRPFTFTAAATNGQSLNVTFSLRDGSTSLSNAVFKFVIGSASSSFTNTAKIVINDLTNATPYPATISVDSVGGSLSNLTVTFFDLYHTWPSDIDALLVSPEGQKTLLMAKCGDGKSVTDINLTFDDAASSALSYTNRLDNSTNRPTSFAVAPPPFESPAPPAPYNTNLSVFKGSNPRGLWSLYIIDDSSGNRGVISNGWALNLISVNPVGSAADLVIASTGSPNPVTVSSNIIYSIRVTNFGPSTATGVVVTNSLPATTVFAPAASTPGADASVPGLVVYRVGALPKDASTNITIAALTTATNVFLTNLVWVSAATPDPNTLNNTNRVIASVNDFVADLELDMAVAPDPVPLGGTLTYTLTALNHGPATAPALAISNNLPPLNKVAFVSASPAGYLINGNVVLFTNLGNLGSGAQTSVTINVRTLSAGTVTNDATATSAFFDPEKGNNSAKVKAVVQPPPVSALLARSGTFTISWSVAADTNYVLESTESLSHPNWKPADNPAPVRSGDQFSVTVGTTNGARFFRLRAVEP